MDTIYGDLYRGQWAPDAVALCCEEKALNFSAFFYMIAQAEAGFRRLGVQAGDRVTLISLATPEAIAAFYAMDKIGAVANWVDMKLNGSEVEYYLCLGESRVVVVLSLAFEKVYQNRGNSPVEHVIVLPMEEYLPEKLREKLSPNRWKKREDCLAWEEFLQVPEECTPEWARYEEPAVITYTGGTTGPTKGVMLSRRSFHVSLEQYTEAKTEVGRGGRALTLLPPFAAFGLCQCIHIPLCLGMTVILAPLFRPGDLGELLVRYRPEQVNGTTAYWQQLLGCKEIEDLSFLKNPRCGGDALSPESERRINVFLASRGCRATLIKEYGMSEVCGITCLSYGDASEIGTVGRPLPGSEIAIVNPHTGEACADGEQGEVLIWSRTVMNGYFKASGADREVLRPGPNGQLWVWTGDWGYRSTGGEVVISGRRKRMISRNGFKIFPVVVEDCLLQCPLVDSCAVVGGESASGETVPVAHIVLRPGIEAQAGEQELRNRCQATLNAYLIPVAYVFHWSLPLTDRGKLDYRALERQTKL